MALIATTTSYPKLNVGWELEVGKLWRVGQCADLARISGWRVLSRNFNILQLFIDFIMRVSMSVTTLY